MTVTRSIDLGDLTARELAELFCNMCSDEQAEFFNQVGEIAKPWPGSGWCQQAHAIANEAALSSAGKAVLIKLGEHSGLTQ